MAKQRGVGLVRVAAARHARHLVVGLVKRTVGAKEPEARAHPVHVGVHRNVGETVGEQQHAGRRLAPHARQLAELFARRAQGLVLEARVGQADVPRQPARQGRVHSLWRREPASTITGTAPAVTQPASLVGATGLALSDLRPGGFAQIGRRRVDVVTQGDYIRVGEPVEVIADEGYRRVVRRLEDGQQGATD